MKKNDLIKHDGTIFRILAINDSNILAIDCIKRSMPQWYSLGNIESIEFCTEQELYLQTDTELFEIDFLDSATKKIIHERFTLVAGVLPFVDDEKMRTFAINTMAAEKDVSKQTIRNYLCLYLAYQNLSALAPKRIKDDRPLTRDEKNMRWALNKFFYTQHKNSLNTAYTFMLKEKYTDKCGNPHRKNWSRKQRKRIFRQRYNLPTALPRLPIMPFLLGAHPRNPSGKTERKHKENRTLIS